MQSLILNDKFNQKLENLPNNLQSLTLGNDFNQKIEKIPNSLQSLTLGRGFDHKLNACLALPKLQIIEISENYKGILPIIFGTTIIINDYDNNSKKEIKNQDKQKYDFSEWKNIFYKSMKDLL